MPSEVYQSIVNCVDDSKASDVITKNAYDSFVKLFPKGGWSVNEGMEYAWTGIIGMVCHSCPCPNHADICRRLLMRYLWSVISQERKDNMSQQGIMGMVRVPHMKPTTSLILIGMARIFLCAPSLASYILDGEWDPKMPKSFQMTSDRIERLKRKVVSMKKKEVDAESRLQPALEKVTI